MSRGSTAATATSADVVGFWRDAGPERWFEKDAAFDAAFGARFGDAHFAAARREFDGWKATADGVLALLILLDQFPRNVFRGCAHMYATDPLARQVAGHGIAQGLDRAIDAELRLFCYLPFAHSEDLADQDRSVALMRTLGAEPLAHAEGHRDIVRRFGRFPHRNALLARTTTPEEQVFLDAGGFAG
ncbi:DUF924 family protein [Dokdonella koreensis]|uniref:DUF924 domain containing protein n=1 Tax=Dokdonella koreensis DS-123 TaxID=1300342 RepID=A0A161HIY5_9GAMM|nr:DUF924 family protein [Dokdonella koreensis]ANB16460.1 DUF924 domain containing protein [Dokdonella koreensis DS-123]